MDTARTSFTPEQPLLAQSAPARNFHSPVEKGGHGNLEVTASLSLEAVGPGAAHPDSEEEGGESEGAMAMAKARLWARPIFSIARSPPSFLPNPVAPHLAPLLLCRPALINPSSLLSLLFFVTIAPTSKICFTIGSFGVAPLRVVNHRATELSKMCA
ncbi:uncharacterized protein [Physcomitrium patens]|uniref:uncharacterized protein n=1 Tax=Physcomitrium patens TaxID=3218 RepID=UPI003CCD7D17